MQRRHRLNQIVSAVVDRGQVDVPSLATEFAVSRATIRRDLEALQRQRLVCRTHGGAKIHAAFNDLPLSYKKARDAAPPGHRDRLRLTSGQASAHVVLITSRIRTNSCVLHAHSWRDPI